MTIASKIYKEVAIRKQTGLGTVGADNGQIIRRVSGVGQAIRDMHESSEVVSHHQHSGSNYGKKSTSYSLNGEYSAGTYQLLIESMLEANDASVGAYNSGTDTTPDAAGTFTDASAGYLTAGLKVGMIGRWTGFAAGAAVNNSKNFLITGLTASVMTGVFLNGDSVTTAVAGDDATFTPVGAFVSPPLASHTKNYLQIEDWYSDLTDSDLFTDCVVTGMNVNMPATGNATVEFSLVGLSRTLSGSQVMSSAVAETETHIMSSLNGFLYVNGTSTRVTGLQLSIQNGGRTTTAESGSNSPADIVRGTIRVSGSFSSLLRDQVISALYDAETEVSLIVAMAEDETDTADCMSITLGKVKITGDAPNDDDEIIRTYPFIAEINHDGGTGTAWNETIITVQDSAFA